MNKARHIVEANEFHLTDSDNRTRAIIISSPIDGMPTMQFLNEHLIPVLSIGMERGSTFVTLLHQNGSAGVSLNMRNDGRLGIVVAHPDGRQAFEASIDSTGRTQILHDGAP